MNSIPNKWAEVVSVVERAHFEASKDLKERERMIHLKYVEAASEKMRKQKEEENIKRVAELQERLRLEQEERNEKNLKRITREMRMKKEREYCLNNFEMAVSHKVTPKQPAPQEHPFIKLVDQEEKRRQHFRENLRRQNEVNSIQQRIKLKQRSAKQTLQREQREKYENHVEAFYLKKLQDRNIFKNKYLKLTNPQRNQALPTSFLQNTTIEKDYESFNNSIIKKPSHMNNNDIDPTLSKINRKIEVPDNSPAYLGRIPLHTDRMKQLQYLQRSTKLINKSKRMKTEGDIAQSSPQARRYTTQAQQMTTLEHYYNNLSVKDPANNVESFNASPTPISSHKRNSTNDYGVRNQTVLKRNLEPIESKQAEKDKNRVFSTYDIIQNKRKFVCL